MMRTLALLFCGLLLGLSDACARLGDSEQELVARFGKVRSRQEEHASFEGRGFVVGPLFVFHMDQWTIYAVMIDGRCARISYGKVGAWSDDQVETVFNVNGAATNWTVERASKSLVGRTWKRNDGATANWSVLGLQLTHPAYERRLAVLKAKAEAESRRVPKL